MPLEEKYNWKELCDLTLGRIKQYLKPREEATFKKWFMAREQLGYLFDYQMILRAFRIWQELKDGLDHFIVISGREGFGKSTFAIQLAAWVNPNFTMSSICYGARGYLDVLGRKAEEYNGDSSLLETESILLDEGTELLSRESLNMTNRVLTKSFFIQRALKFLVITCIPNFFMLDITLRNHRARTLIEVLSRGHYICITGSGIRKIAKEGLQSKQIKGISLKKGTFWHGSFRKKFPITVSRQYSENN